MGRRQKTGYRKHLQFHAEYIQEKKGCGKSGNASRQHFSCGNHAFHCSALCNRPEDSQPGSRDYRRQKRRDSHRRGQRPGPPDNFRHAGSRLCVGNAQISPQQIAHIGEILGNQRFTQPVLLLKGVYHLLGNRSALERTARHKMNEKEGRRSQYKKGENPCHDSFSCIAEHFSSPAFLIRIWI